MKKGLIELSNMVDELTDIVNELKKYSVGDGEIRLDYKDRTVYYITTEAQPMLVLNMWLICAGENDKMMFYKSY